MRVVDCRQHLSVLHAVAFVRTDLDDVAHHLTGNLARLRRAHGSDGFQPVRYGRPLRDNHWDVAYRFHCCGLGAMLVGTPGQPST